MRINQVNLVALFRSCNVLKQSILKIYVFSDVG